MADSTTPIGEVIRSCAGPGAAGAWEEFVRKTHRLIASVVMRTARRWGERSPSAVDDLVQETYLKLCSDRARLLREFESRSPESFYSYLKVVTANVVHDYFKARASEKRGGGRADQGADPAAAEAVAENLGSPRSLEREVLLGEIDELLRRRLSGETRERDRTIFWLYYRHGMTARAIASLPSIDLSTKGVESTILRLTRLVRGEMAEARLGRSAAQGRAP